MIRASKVLLAAALAASLPAAAAARDCDHGDPAPVAWGGSAASPIPPTPPPAWREDHWRDGRWHDGRWRDGRWREARWRERQLDALRAEFRALDDERALFYAQPGVRRGQARRFERYYAERRAELERRWSALQLVAMR